MVKGLSLKKLILLITAVIALILFFVFKGIVNTRINSLEDQQIAKRWSSDGGYSQISAFFNSEAEVTTDTLGYFEYQLEDALKQESITVTSENPSARLFASCYTAEGNLSVTNSRGSVSLDALGVSGDFFLFHPVELISGEYFDSDDVGEDYCLIDEVAAWKLFGSSDVAGQIVYVGDVPLEIRGVYRQPEDKKSKAAGAVTQSCYVNYSFLENNGSIGAITSYEIVMPNPVPDYALGKVRDTLGINEENVVYVENNTRFSYINRFNLLKNFSTRSMVTNGVAFPWWENLARSAEDFVTVFTVLYILLILYSLITVLVLAIILIYMNRELIRNLFMEYIVKRICLLFNKIFARFTKRGGKRGEL